MSGPDYLLRLISESLGHFLMHSLHFRVREARQLIVSCLMCRDLRCACTFHALLFEVGLNLLTSGARSTKVLACVAGNFRLTTFPLSIS